MNATIKNSPLPAVVEQITHNTTSWIGHRPGADRDIISGQTFIAPSEGDLETIEVFPSFITDPGKVVLTLHSFDPLQKSWGPVLSSASINLDRDDTDKWITFKITGLHLDEGKTYGFRLESPDAFIGFGEAAGSHQQPPFNSGQEWQFTNSDKRGLSFSYFSLAFKVGLRT